MTHIVSGGGGADLYKQKTNVAPLLSGGKGRAIHHYCHFEINGLNLKMQAKTPEGEVIVDEVFTDEALTSEGEKEEEADE